MLGGVSPLLHTFSWRGAYVQEPCLSLQFLRKYPRSTAHDVYNSLHDYLEPMTDTRILYWYATLHQHIDISPTPPTHTHSM